MAAARMDRKQTISEIPVSSIEEALRIAFEAAII